MLLLASAHAFDPAAWQRVLDARLRDGRVDYAAIKADPRELDGFLSEVRATPLASLSGDERKAFLINAYNALTVDLVADAWPIDSIRSLDGGKVWDTRRFDVGGSSLTLNQLEDQLRAGGDPRIHAALNCASLGCAPLATRAYTATGLDAQLDAASARWVAGTTVGDTVTVSRIFEWYGQDFVAKFGTPDVPGVDGTAEAAVNFVARYLPSQADRLRKGGYRVAYAEYDWRINAPR